MIAWPRPWSCSGASTPSPRGRGPKGNEPLKQQSSSTTIRRERVRPIWTQSELCGPAPTSLESPFRKSQSAVCRIGGR